MFIRSVLYAGITNAYEKTTTGAGRPARSREKRAGRTHERARWDLAVGPVGKLGALQQNLWNRLEFDLIHEKILTCYEGSG